MWWRSPNQLNAAKIGGSTVVQAVPTFGLGSARSDPDPTDHKVRHAES
jgi:hypothetical protein